MRSTTTRRMALCARVHTTVPSAPEFTRADAERAYRAAVRTPGRLPVVVRAMQFMSRIFSR